MAGGGATICVRALAALCCTLLVTTGRATSKATTTTRTGSGANGRAFGNGGELGRRGSSARSTAWANHNHGNRKPLISSLRGGGDVSPELGPYTWIPAGEGDGGSLVRLSDTGEVVAGQVTPTSSDGAGKVAIASVTAAVAAVFAKFRVGRGSDPAATSGGDATPAAASQKDAEPGVASMVKKGVAAPKETSGAGAGVNTAAKKKKAAKALNDRKTAAARALKDKKAAADRVLKEKKAAAERAAKEKRVAVSQATMSVVQNATRKSTGVSPSWPMFSAFLYFLAMAFTIPVLPKVVNELITGSNAVTAASATLYGLLSSTDASFTLMTVKFHASMSDKYGRRPFLALSALGLGLGFFLTYHSRRVWMLLLASAIDGCTSCMYRQAKRMAQACITDCVGTGAGLGEAFGLFQGLSLGMAFMIGLPMGGVLGAKYGVRFPLLVSVGLCLVNFAMIALVMPETLPDEKRVKKVDLKQANPLGAVTMATRNHLITGVFACWTLLWIAHVGLQINWINYTDRKFGWGVAQSGASLALMGLLVAVFPKLIIPRLGLERSISTGLLIYTVGQLVIAAAPGVSQGSGMYGTPMAVLGLVLASAGTIVFPSMLAYLCNQVGDGEVGALQGTTDTAKTVCSVLFGPAMAWIFGYFISDNAYPRKIEGASYYVGAAVAALAYLTARRTFAVHGALDKVPPRARSKR
ncbi:unnamed protein product [Ectocarpus sp. 4 AP-2014]